MLKEMSRLLPDNKSRFNSVEELLYKFSSNISFELHTKVNNEFDDLFKTLYSLDDKTYCEIRKKLKVPYDFFKENANVVNEIILSDDILPKLDAFAEILKRKKSTVCRVLSDNEPKRSDRDAYGKYVELLLDENCKEVVTCKKRLEEVLSTYETMPIIGEFSKRTIAGIQVDLLKEARARYKGCIAKKAKSIEGDLNGYAVDNHLRLSKRYTN